MPLASTSLVQLRYVPETIPGTTPSSGRCIELRLTGESLDFNVQSETSKEIRADRQTTDLVLVGASCEGGFNFELSSLEYDKFIESVLQGDWDDVFTGGHSPTMAITIVAGAGGAGGSLKIPSGASLTAMRNKVIAGQWLRLTAPDDAADQAYLKVVSIGTDGTIIISPDTPVPGSGTRNNVPNCVLFASRCSNGVHQRFFSFEKEFSDVGLYKAFQGMSPSKMTLSFESGSIVNGTFEFIGMTSSSMSATTSLPGTPIPTQTLSITNAVTGVGHILGGGINIANTFIQSLSFDIDNALRGQTAIGHFGFVGVASGTVAITGTMQVYLKDKEAYELFINNEAASISWAVRDGDNNGYVFTLPKIKYTGGQVVAGAINQDVMIEMPFTALMDDNLRKTLFIDRLYGPGVTLV